MADSTTLGHMVTGFARMLRRQQSHVDREAAPVSAPPPEDEPGMRPRRKRQATLPLLAKRKAKRKARNRMARQSRRINRS